MSKLKVWGGQYWPPMSNGTRAIIATKTKKAAMEASGLSAYTFNNFWCITANPAEVKAALEKPGVLLEAVDHMHRKYKEA